MDVEGCTFVDSPVHMNSRFGDDRYGFFKINEMTLGRKYRMSLSNDLAGNG